MTEREFHPTVVLLSSALLLLASHITSAQASIIEDLKASDGESNSIVVSWRLSGPRPATLVGYKLGFITAPGGEVNIMSPIAETSDGSSWQAVLKNMTPGVNYKLMVMPMLTIGFGPMSEPIYYTIEQIGPDISISVVLVGQQTALVSYEFLKNREFIMQKLLYAKSEDSKWKEVQFDSEKKMATISDLEPNVQYVFQARAKLGDLEKVAITHVMTSLSELSKPTQVTAEADQDGVVNVIWRQENFQGITGFIVTVEEQQVGSSYSFHSEVTVLAPATEVNIKGLNLDFQYRFTVTPYDMRRLGDSPEPCVLRDADAGVSDESEVQSAPVFSPQLPQQLGVVQGEPLQLSCAAQGTPTPLVQWYADGVPLGEQTSGRADLAVEKVDQAFAAICMADNAAGSRVTLVNIILAEETKEETTQPLQFTSAFPEKLMVAPGDGVNVTCSVSGSPAPSIRWYRDTFMVAEAASGELSVLYRNESVQGDINLLCIASNKYQLISKECQIISQVSSSTTAVMRSDVQTTAPLSASSSTPPSSPSSLPPSPSTFPSSLASSPSTSLLSSSIPSLTTTSTSPTTTPEKVPTTTPAVVPTTTPAAVPTTTPALVPTTTQELFDPSYLLTLHVIETTHSSLRIAWFVTKGDLARVSSFKFGIYTLRGRKIAESKMKKTQREISLSDLIPASSYLIKVRALASRNVPLAEVQATVRTLPKAQCLDFSNPEVILMADELRDAEFRVGWVLKRVDTSLVKGFRFRVRAGSSKGKILLSRKVASHIRLFHIAGVIPNWTFYVSVDVLGHDDESFLVSGLQSKTPPRGGEYDPVSGESTLLKTVSPTPCVIATEAPTTTTPPTTTFKEMTTTVTLPPTTTESIVVTTIPVTTTEATSTTAAPITTTLETTTTTLPPTTTEPIVVTTIPVTTAEASSTTAAPITTTMEMTTTTLPPTTTVVTGQEPLEVDFYSAIATSTTIEVKWQERHPGKSRVQPIYGSVIRFGKYIDRKIKKYKTRIIPSNQFSYVITDLDPDSLYKVRVSFFDDKRTLTDYVYKVVRTTEAETTTVPPTITTDLTTRRHQQQEHQRQQHRNSSSRNSNKRISSNQNSSDRISSTRISSNRINSNKISSNRISSTRISSNRNSSNKISSNRNSSNKISSNRVSSICISSHRGSTTTPSVPKLIGYISKWGKDLTISWKIEGVDLETVAHVKLFIGRAANDPRAFLNKEFPVDGSHKLKNVPRNL
ncbi:hypothetical protein PoB_000357400 [Plakobranchus ocellatus]|uniref:Uncharacterized protein n=1 Tax=Plakobranchus ocellatus TaxID=259542 RepID=A0AAV3Y2B4_9GAST|nr:hypothetical protein PoB_000357400 [Plakobranchus ocellatus]